MKEKEKVEKEKEISVVEQMAPLVFHPDLTVGDTGLLKDLKEAEDDYLTKQYMHKLREAQLFAYTNFKELGYTNEKQRKAHVDLKLDEGKEGYPHPLEVLGAKITYNHLLREFKLVTMGIDPEDVELLSDEEE